MKILITLTGLASFLGLTSFSCAAEGAQAGSARVGDGPRSAISTSGHDLRPLSEEHIAEIAKQLSPLQAKVALNAGTERAFTGETWDEKRPGTYVSIVGGLPLFRSDDKFESGTGWPSFTRPIDPAHVVLKRDGTLGMSRTEVLDARSGAHLGHVFDDGPRPTGKRYCINSASLRFIPDGEPLPEESQPLPLAKAYFAGGCFWGVEDVFEQIPGVVSAVSGYMGGQLEKPTYKAICRGDTGHAETVEITFAPAIASYEALLKVFFDNHDPTTLNRQGPDFGEQYRSAIFAADAAQQQAAKKFVADLAKTERFTDRRIVTQILAPGAPFWPAEEYHQDYHQKHGGSCKVKVY